MTKTYKVKWYDWHAGHYNEKECSSEQLNPLLSKLNAKTDISDITISEVNTKVYTNYHERMNLLTLGSFFIIIKL